MPFTFHRDERLYYEHQRLNARHAIIPFAEGHVAIRPGLQVLEIGCGQGGVMKAFAERGCRVTGVDLDQAKIALGREHLAKEVAAGQARLVAWDIYDVDPEADLGRRFDLLVMKDAIEHIHDQQRLLLHLRRFLRPDGLAYFGFPPWQMPFGGHQQICAGRLAMLLPWYHLLPRALYRQALQALGECPETIEALLEIKQTGISIERFERIARAAGWATVARRLYLVNPIYRYKFGLRGRVQWGPAAALPGMRNLLTTCAYYLLAPRSLPSRVEG
jgi:SAM-dependent methyltransferase